MKFPYVSYLRVFEPLDVFDDEQQLLIMSQRGRGRDVTENLDRGDSLRRITRTVSDPFPHSSEDLIRVLHYPTSDGITAPRYCPNQLAVRSTLAAESLSSSLRDPLLGLLVPEAARDAQQSRLDPDNFVESLAKLHTRSSTWGIPFGWFVLFREDDHTERVETDHTLQTVRLAAPVPQCIDRARYAAASLAVAAPGLDLLEELTELIEWLETFTADAIVELDYGRVAELVYPDESPSDVHAGIESLADGDMTGAAAAYRRLAGRWIKIRQLARAS
ncbi:hypothetical protein E4J89_08375 [Arthrobacter sp. CAU 1506]|uniref:hypothetical protein n=1 Tax=Arthrobacter sp. CAU 1506 TaxID=2560052 RepID=UPI0010AD21DA|nr:hypothetical protein [Arthrobacter sp. CAU 1506]TJY70169.1 hypothetical protein E4J89_08375 [Arthrobacter sp. CAU 1506]